MSLFTYLLCTTMRDLKARVYYETQWSNDLTEILDSVSEVFRRELSINLKFEIYRLNQNIHTIINHISNPIEKMKEIASCIQDVSGHVCSTLILINNINCDVHGIATIDNWNEEFCYAVVQWYNKDVEKDNYDKRVHLATHGICHEFGHNLGFDHKSYGIMSDSNVCDYLRF